MDEPVERRIGRNEVTFRRVNEALEPDEGTANYVCECGRLGCTQTIALTRPEYESVRTSFTRFFVVPGHEEPDVEEVVEDHDHYLVVEKRGAAAGVAEADAGDRRAGDETPS